MQNAPLTELEKLLYNKHLAVSRSLKNKPFRIKKDFGDIIDTDKHKYLKRLSTLFKKHPEIDFDTFFQAPYKLYPDVEYFGLDYFSTMRAIKAYTTYKKQIFLQDPDSQIDGVKQTLQFIANFCIQNDVPFYQYPFHRTADLFTWMSHYKQNKINVYAMMEFRDVYSSLLSLAEDVQKFYVGQFVENFRTLYLSYEKSAKLKPYTQKAFTTVNNFVNEQLTIKKNKLTSEII